MPLNSRRSPYFSLKGNIYPKRTSYCSRQVFSFTDHILSVLAYILLCTVNRKDKQPIAIGHFATGNKHRHFIWGNDVTVWSPVKRCFLIDLIHRTSRLVNNWVYGPNMENATRNMQILPCESERRDCFSFAKNYVRITGSLLAATNCFLAEAYHIRRYASGSGY